MTNEATSTQALITSLKDRMIRHPDGSISFEGSRSDAEHSDFMKRWLALIGENPDEFDY